MSEFNKFGKDNKQQQQKPQHQQQQQRENPLGGKDNLRKDSNIRGGQQGDKNRK